MRTLVTSLIATTAALTLTTTANALEDIKIEFKFNRSAPIEVTYADIKKATKSACRPLRRGRNLAMRISMERNCRHEMTGKLVNAVGIDALVAMHEKETGGPNRQKFAGL